MDAAAQPMVERLPANVACDYAPPTAGSTRDGDVGVRVDAIDAWRNTSVSHCAWAVAVLVSPVFCIDARVAWLVGDCLFRADLYFGTDDSVDCARRADMAATRVEYDIAALLAVTNSCDDARPLRAVHMPPFLG